MAHWGTVPRSIAESAENPSQILPDSISSCLEAHVRVDALKNEEAAAACCTHNITLAKGDLFQ